VGKKVGKQWIRVCILQTVAPLYLKYEKPEKHQEGAPVQYNAKQD